MAHKLLAELKFSGISSTGAISTSNASSISDTSDIPQRLFTGQFTRWTIQLEVQDAFLYNIPYRKNWKIYIDDEQVLDPKYYSVFEVAENLTTEDVIEQDELDFNFKRTE